MVNPRPPAAPPTRSSSRLKIEPQRSKPSSSSSITKTIRPTRNPVTQAQLKRHPPTPSIATTSHHSIQPTLKLGPDSTSCWIDLIGVFLKTILSTDPQIRAQSLRDHNLHLFERFGWDALIGRSSPSTSSPSDPNRRSVLSRVSSSTLQPSSPGLKPSVRAS